jgi:hypothetical protein
MRILNTSLWLLLWTLPASALAQPRADREVDREVDRHKEAAHTAFELGHYSKAIANYESAYRLKRDPRLLYNIALAYWKRHQVERQPGDLLKARDLFRRFLALVSPAAPRYAAQRSTLRKVRRLARDYLAEIDQLVAASPQRPETRPPTSPATSQPASAPARPARPRSAARTAPPPRPVPGEALPRTPEDRPPEARRRWLPWTLYAAAGTLALAATVTGALALRTEEENHDLAAARDPAANSAADRADALALATDLLLGAALAAGTAGLITHLLGRTRRGARISFRGTSLVLRY